MLIYSLNAFTKQTNKTKKNPNQPQKQTNGKLFCAKVIIRTIGEFDYFFPLKSWLFIFLYRKSQ